MRAHFVKSAFGNDGFVISKHTGRKVRLDLHAFLGQSVFDPGNATAGVMVFYDFLEDYILSQP